MDISLYPEVLFFERHCCYNLSFIDSYFICIFMTPGNRWMSEWLSLIKKKLGVRECFPWVEMIRCGCPSIEDHFNSRIGNNCNYHFNSRDVSSIVYVANVSVVPVLLAQCHWQANYFRNNTALKSNKNEVHEKHKKLQSSQYTIPFRFFTHIYTHIYTCAHARTHTDRCVFIIWHIFITIVSTRPWG